MTGPRVLLMTFVAWLAISVCLVALPRLQTPPPQPARICAVQKNGTVRIHQNPLGVQGTVVPCAAVTD